MIKNNAIDFSVWEDHEPIEIQLEPECYVFKVTPGNSIKFVAVECRSEFEWAVRVSNGGKSIQLYPESDGNYELEVYENDVLLQDWFKYM